MRNNISADLAHAEKFLFSADLVITYSYESISILSESFLLYWTDCIEN